MGQLPIPPDLGPTPVAARTAKALTRLADGLDHDAALPAKKPSKNLLIGTWNIALFGGLTRKWTSKAGDSPKRNLTDLCCIAEVVSRFDVCAIQETKRDLTALRSLMHILGKDWSFIVSDVTEGDPGNDERLCFVYDPTAHQGLRARRRARYPLRRARRDRRWA